MYDQDVLAGIKTKKRREKTIHPDSEECQATNGREIPKKW